MKNLSFHRELGLPALSIDSEDTAHIDPSLEAGWLVFLTLCIETRGSVSLVP